MPPARPANPHDFAADAPAAQRPPAESGTRAIPDAEGGAEWRPRRLEAKPRRVRWSAQPFHPSNRRGTRPRFVFGEPRSAGRLKGVEEGERRE